MQWNLLKKKRGKNRCSNKKCKSVECYHENEPKKEERKSMNMNIFYKEKSIRVYPRALFE